MTIAPPAPRAVDRDEITFLLETLRDQHPDRAWPSVRQAQQAVRDRWRIGIGSDRMRALLYDAQSTALPDDAGDARASLGARAEEIHARAATAARARRLRKKQEREGTQGKATARVDDVRALLTEAVRRAASGETVAQIVDPLVAKFHSFEAARAALLRDDPAPTTDTALSDPAPAAPDAAPDVDSNDQAPLAASAPDAAPDDLTFLVH